MAVPRGVMAAAAVMQGSRGGVDLPDKRHPAREEPPGAVLRQDGRDRAVGRGVTLEVAGSSAGSLGAGTIASVPPGARTIASVLEEARAGLSRLTPVEAHLAVSGGALLVDTRTPWQREAQGELPGAVVIDRTVLEWRLDPTSDARIPEAGDYDRLRHRRLPAGVQLEPGGRRSAVPGPVACDRRHRRCRGLARGRPAHLRRARGPAPLTSASRPPARPAVRPSAAAVRRPAVRRALCAAQSANRARRAPERRAAEHRVGAERAGPRGGPRPTRRPAVSQPACPAARSACSACRRSSRSR